MSTTIDPNRADVISVTLFRKLWRAFLIILNIMLIVPACLLIFASFKVANDHQHTDAALSLASQSNPILTYSCVFGATLGVIIVCIYGLGLYGAIKRSDSILLTYAAILSILFILLSVTIISTYTISTEKHRKAYEELDKAYVNSSVSMYNYVDPNDLQTRMIDNIQKKFACCGFNSPNDWLEYSFHKIPKSCCSEPVESSLPVFKYCPESDYKTGCWRPMVEHFYSTILPSLRQILYSLLYFKFAMLVATLFVLGTGKKNLDVV